MSSYFRYIPNIDYVNRTSRSLSSIDQYITTKNLFKRVRLRDDIFGNLNFFEKYQIIGDERPDNVAYKIYSDEVLDWIILLSNNIINVQSEWPMTQREFETYLFEKYGPNLENSEDVYNVIYNGVHHFETIEVKDNKGKILLKEGIIFTPPKSLNQITNPVYPKFKLNYFDSTSSETGNVVTLDGDKIYKIVTNYDYELKLENDKRNIYILKPQYLNIIFNDLDNSMPYSEGSSQYIGPFLKRVDDIRLYQ